MERICFTELPALIEDGRARIAAGDRTFLDAVLSGDASKVRSPYADAYKSVAFTIACNKSMETGMPVKVEY